MKNIKKGAMRSGGCVWVGGENKERPSGLLVRLLIIPLIPLCSKLTDNKATTSGDSSFLFTKSRRTYELIRHFRYCLPCMTYLRHLWFSRVSWCSPIYSSLDAELITMTKLLSSRFQWGNWKAKTEKWQNEASFHFVIS